MKEEKSYFFSHNLPSFITNFMLYVDYTLEGFEKGLPSFCRAASVEWAVLSILYIQLLHSSPQISLSLGILLDRSFWNYIWFVCFCVCECLFHPDEVFSWMLLFWNLTGIQHFSCITHWDPKNCRMSFEAWYRMSKFCYVEFYAENLRCKLWWSQIWQVKIRCNCNALNVSTWCVYFFWANVFFLFLLITFCVWSWNSCSCDPLYCSSCYTLSLTVLPINKLLRFRFCGANPKFLRNIFQLHRFWNVVHSTEINHRVKSMPHSFFCSSPFLQITNTQWNSIPRLFSLRIIFFPLRFSVWLSGCTKYSRIFLVFLVFLFHLVLCYGYRMR